MSSSDILRCPRVSVAIVMAFVLAAIANAQDLPRGPVPSGSLQVTCRAPSCKVALPFLADFTIAENQVRVVSSVPGGSYLVRIGVGSSEFETHISVCGALVRVEIRPDAVLAPTGTCPEMGTLRFLGVDDEATIAVDGVPVDGVGAHEVSVFVGEHDILAERAGFEAFMQTVFVGAEEEVDIRPELRPVPGLLVLELPDDRVTVHVNGETWFELGEVSSEHADEAEWQHGGLQLRRPPGPTTIRVERAGYEPSELVSHVIGGETVRVEPAFVPLPATLTISTFPQDARVTIDSRDVVGGSPLSLEPGTHVVRATASGFEPYQTTLEVGPGETVSLHLELVGRPVTLWLRGVPPDAMVSVDGGEAVPAAGAVSVRPGNRVLTLSAPGYTTAREEVLVDTSIVQTIDVELRRSAFLSFTGLPDGAEIFVDGQTVRPSSGVVEVPAGTRTILVRASGYANHQQSLVLAEGASRVLEINLEPNPGSVRLPRLPTGIRVFLDDREVEVVNDTIPNVPVGEHQLRLESDVHEPLILHLRVAPGSETAVSDLDFKFREAKLVLEGAPEGTRVKVDDQEVITYTVPIGVPVGEHELWIAADGYERVHLTVEVGPGEYLIIPVEFAQEGSNP